MNHEEIGLQELIYRVKRELLTPDRAAQARDPYPLFAIEKIELEITVKVVRDHDGTAKLSVLNFAEISAGQTVSREHGHLIRIALTPLIPHNELVNNLLADDETRQNIIRDLRRSMIKGDDDLGGEPE